MAGEIATIEFEGIYGIEGGSYTHAHGTTPGVFSIRSRPQPTTPRAMGNVTIRQGATALVFPDCIIDQAELTIDGSGQVLLLTVLDRRWKWRYPRISGQYNLYLENGELDLATDKSPQDLATLLLEAMGETGFNVGALPNDARPTADWDNAIAAQELESLCEALGCRVMLAAGSKVLIARLGEGDQLPQTPEIMSGGAVLDPPEAPDVLHFIGAPDAFGVDLELEAVGYDLKREPKPIDELSYTPTDGWATADSEGYLDELADKKLRGYAKQSLYRMYRVKIPAGGLRIPGYDKPIRHRWQLEFLDKLIATQPDDAGEIPQSPFVYGKWFDGRDKGGNNLDDGVALAPMAGGIETPEETTEFYPFGFSFDGRAQIVHFGGMVYREAKSGTDITTEPATLYLRACVNIRDETTREYFRTVCRKPTGFKYGTKPGVVEQPEYVRTTYPNYTTDFNTFTLTDNADEFQRDAAYYVNLAIAELQTKNPQRITYEVIKAIHLDGAIQQVTWEVSNSGTPKTTACRNNDIDPIMPSYRERRRLQRNQHAAAVLAKFSKLFNSPRAAGGVAPKGIVQP
jgi:hypothetical protein